MYSKKGLSGIITTLIIVAIALAVIGVIWFVINNLIDDTETEIEQGSQDLWDTCYEAGGTTMINNSHITDITLCDTSANEVRIVGGEYCCISL